MLAKYGPNHVIAAHGAISKKWSLMIIGNVGLLGHHRFNELLRGIPGITPRMLSKRLRELEKEGLIFLVVKRPNLVRWDLTAKGRDAIPILNAFMGFGSKWGGLVAEVQDSMVPSGERGDCPKRA